MDESSPPDGGMLHRVLRFLKTLREVGVNRVELFLLEVQEERIRLFDALLLLAAGLLCVLMTLIMVTVMILVFFWDTHRLLALGGLTILYAVGAVIAMLKLRSLLHHWQAFSGTLDQLKKDSECFKNTH